MDLNSVPSSGVLGAIYQDDHHFSLTVTKIVSSLGALHTGAAAQGGDVQGVIPATLGDAVQSALRTEVRNRKATFDDCGEKDGRQDGEPHVEEMQGLLKIGTVDNTWNFCWA